MGERRVLGISDIRTFRASRHFGHPDIRTSGHCRQFWTCKTLGHFEQALRCVIWPSGHSDIPDIWTFLTFIYSHSLSLSFFFLSPSIIQEMHFALIYRFGKINSLISFFPKPFARQRQVRRIVFEGAPKEMSPQVPCSTAALPSGASKGRSCNGHS